MRILQNVFFRSPVSYNGSGQGKSSEQRLWKRQRFFFFLNDRESGLFAGLCDEMLGEISWPSGDTAGRFWTS